MVLRHAQAQTRAVARGAFTLMEVLVVVAILVVLAGVGGVVYIKYLDKAKEDAARTQVHVLDEAVQAHKVQSGGDYPQTLRELTQPQDGHPAALQETALRDPWGNEYKYEPQNRDATGRPHIYATTPGGQTIDNFSR
jgi:general secretion pathway protein G